MQQVVGHKHQKTSRLSMTGAAEAMTNTCSLSDYSLPAGKIVAVQGLKGELLINPASEFPERFTEPGTRWLKAWGKAPREIELKSGRQLLGKSVIVMGFARVESREAAEALIG